MLQYYIFSEIISIVDIIEFSSFDRCRHNAICRAPNRMVGAHTECKSIRFSSTDKKKLNKLIEQFSVCNVSVRACVSERVIFHFTVARIASTISSRFGSEKPKTQWILNW